MLRGVAPPRGVEGGDPLLVGPDQRAVSSIVSVCFGVTVVAVVVSLVVAAVYTAAVG